MQSLKDKRLEEFKRKYPKQQMDTFNGKQRGVLMADYESIEKFFSESMDMVEKQVETRGWLDGSECGAVGCKGGAEYCQEHKDLY